MNEQPPANDDEAIQEELVAYLDGELDAEASAAVERRLSQDMDYRQRLQELERAWNLLDHLPRCQASESFARNTVTMIAVTAAKEVENAGSKIRGGLVWLVTTAAALAAGAGGYSLVTAYVARSNTELLKDLPVIENVDLYRNADSADFLRRLDQEGLFSEEVDDAL
jgi:anti-sigma factor RsiW